MIALAICGGAFALVLTLAAVEFLVTCIRNRDWKIIGKEPKVHD